MVRHSASFRRSEKKRISAVSNLLIYNFVEVEHSVTYTVYRCYFTECSEGLLLAFHVVTALYISDLLDNANQMFCFWGCPVTSWCNYVDSSSG
jgi:hypothetical protein